MKTFLKLSGQSNLIKIELHKRSKYAIRNLCIELAAGGIMPSYGLIKQVMENLTIPVFVGIRPRSGDFIYSNAD